MTITQIELEELSVGADYEKVPSRFRPVFEKIATKVQFSEKKNESCLLNRFSG